MLLNCENSSKVLRNYLSKPDRRPIPGFHLSTTGKNSHDFIGFVRQKVAGWVHPSRVRAHKIVLCHVLQGQGVAIPRN